jgi:hypothetical protein
MKWLDLLGIRDCRKKRSKCTDKAVFLVLDLIFCLLWQLVRRLWGFSEVLWLILH